MVVKMKLNKRPGLYPSPLYYSRRLAIHTSFLSGIANKTRIFSGTVEGSKIWETHFLLSIYVSVLSLFLQLGRGHVWRVTNLMPPGPFSPVGPAWDSPVLSLLDREFSRTQPSVLLFFRLFQLNHEPFKAAIKLAQTGSRVMSRNPPNPCHIY